MDYRDIHFFNKVEPFQLRGIVSLFHEWEEVTKLWEEDFSLSQFALVPKSLQKARLAVKAKMPHKEKILPNESNRGSPTNYVLGKIIG